MAKLFPTHPYGTQTTIGRGEHLKNPSITNIKNYFKRYYAPNNVAICMAGDFNPDEVIAKIDHYFGQWKPNPQPLQPAVCSHGSYHLAAGHYYHRSGAGHGLSRLALS